MLIARRTPLGSEPASFKRIWPVISPTGKATSVLQTLRQLRANSFMLTTTPSHLQSAMSLCQPIPTASANLPPPRQLSAGGALNHVLNPHR